MTGGWWAGQGSNLLLLPCEGSTLPVSYRPIRFTELPYTSHLVRFRNQNKSLAKIFAVKRFDVNEAFLPQAIDFLNSKRFVNDNFPARSPSVPVHEGSLNRHALRKMKRCPAMTDIPHARRSPMEHERDGDSMPDPGFDGDGVMTSFQRTFAKARADGWSLFLWRGATYHTRRADIARRP